MKIAVYDPLHAFTPFLSHVGKNHELLWIDVPVNADELRWQHIRCDLVWYEFCDEQFFQMMRGPKECAIINRLHSYELFTDVPGKVDWAKVDLLAVSSDYVKTLLEGRRSVIDFPPMRVLSNGPDMEKLTIPENKQYGKRIAIVSRINYKKNLPLAVYCMDAVKDLGFELHVFGGSQDLRFDMYLRHLIQNLGLEDRIFFHGEVPHDDLMEALGHMDYILSTSLFESFGQGIMEGIGRGCLPLIHDFPGARERFDGMGPIFFSTPIQFRKTVMDYLVGDNAERQETAKINRSQMDKYRLEVQLKELDSILEVAEKAVVNV